MPDDTPNDVPADTTTEHTTTEHTTTEHTITEHTTTENAGAGETGQTRRRPSPAAAAASRARRIGGARAATPAATTPSATTPSAATPSATTPSVKAVTAPGDPAATEADPATPDGDTSTAPGKLSFGKRRAVKGRSASTDTAQAKSDTAQPSTVIDTATDEQPAKPRREPREAPPWARWLPAAVLVAGALIAAIVLATASHGVWWGQPSASEARDKVLAAAKECTVSTNSYSYLTFDADKKKGASCTTGAQTQRYGNAMETLIRAKAKTLKATQTAQINTAGVQSITKGGKQWTVLVFGQVKIITLQTGKTGRIDPFAARVRMDNVNGSWKLSAIDTVTSGAP